MRFQGIPDLLKERNTALLPELLKAVFVLALAGSWVIYTYYLQWMALAIPALILLGMLLLADKRWSVFLMMLLIPVSTEVYLPGGFGTDLPVEPLIVGLMFVFFVWAAYFWPQQSAAPVLHPLFLLLMLHFGWTVISTLASNHVWISTKFSLAKTWYIVSFCLVPLYWLDRRQDWAWLFRYLLILVAAVTAFIIGRHGLEYNFSFQDVNSVLWPFFRNHVSYAAMLSVLLPFAGYFLWWNRAQGKRIWLPAAIIAILLTGIYFSYTRAAYGAVLGAAGFVWILRRGWTRWVLAGAVAAAGIMLLHYTSDNRYMQLAPNYEKTITHTSFDNLLDATIKLEDISTMERLYRWVAGFQMLDVHPGLGFGPGTFYESYSAYTLSSFRTYVSDNPEKLGMHNYYLMIAIEQGIPGLIIYLLLLAAIFLYGERIYHNASNPEDKVLTLTAISCIVVISLLQLMNDLLETDKVGPFFFLSIALLIRVHLRSKKLG